MALDLYDILDIPQTANEAWIRRAADARRQAIDQNAALSANERALQLKAVDEASAILSDPAKRAEYDAKMEKALGAPAAYSIVSLLVSPGVLAFLFVCLVATFITYYNHSKEQARVRVEQERIAAEVDRANKELEQRRDMERERIARMADNEKARIEQQQRAQFERDRKELDNWQRRVQIDTQREEQQRLYVERQQQYIEEAAERRERMEREAEQRRALAELERQKRFLREQERR